MSDSYKELINNLTPYDANRLNYNNKFNPSRQKSYKPPASSNFKKPPLNSEKCAVTKASNASNAANSEITKIMKILKNKSVDKSKNKSPLKSCIQQIQQTERSEQIDEIDEIEKSSKETKITLLKIFMNISNFNKDDNCHFLSYRTLCNFLKNINLVNEKELKLTDVDIMLQKINPNGNRLNSENFLDLILHISEFVDKLFFQNPKISVTNLVKKYFEPFAKNLEVLPDSPTKYRNNHINHTLNSDFFISTINSTNFKQTINENNLILNNHQNLENFMLNFTVDEEIKQILNSVYKTLKEIYLTYFHYENNNYMDKERIAKGSYENLVEFGKDFGCIPYLFSMKQISTYWNLMINTSLEEMLINRSSKDNCNSNLSLSLYGNSLKYDYGAIFTFQKFSLMLVHFSFLSYKNGNVNSTNSNNTKNSEKLIYFFEKLESSQGFVNFSKKSNKSTNAQFKLVPCKDIIEKINPNILFTGKGNFAKIDPLDYKQEDNQLNIDNLSKNKDYRRKSTENFTNLKILKSYNENTENYSLRDLMLINEENFCKLENDLENFREIFQFYTKIGGDKLTYNKINYSSFLRFMKDSKLMTNERSDIRDMNLIEKTQRNTLTINTHEYNQMNKRRSTSSKSNRYTNRRTVFEQDKLLNDTETSDIFTNLTGNKNFTHPTAKSQLDANPGLTATFGKAMKRTTLIDPSYLLKMKTHNVPNKMDFYLFIKSFESIANKLYCNNNNSNNSYCLDEAFRLFYENKVPIIFANFRKKIDSSVLFEGEKKLGIKERLEIIRNEMTEILKDISNLLVHHYHNYCDCYNLLSFEQFFEFFKDFDLYPYMINLTGLKDLYYTLAEEFSYEVEFTKNSPRKSLKNYKNSDRQNDTFGLEQNLFTYDLMKSLTTQENLKNTTLSINRESKELDKIKHKISKNEKINFCSFLESLGVISFNIQYNDRFDNNDRVLYLIEKMNRSKGINKSLLKSGQTFSATKDFTTYLNALKEKYPNFYDKNFEKDKNLRNLKFETIFD